MYKVIFSIFILSISVSSCQKDTTDNSSNGLANCPGTGEYRPIENLDLLNCFYLNGTYWNYVDSITLDTDSVYITSDGSGFITDPCGNNYQTQEFNTISSASNEVTRFVVVRGGLFKDFSGLVGSGRQIYSGFNPLVQNNNVSAFDSIFIYDQFYHQVMKFELINDPIGDQSKKSIYYTNSEFGLLRIEKYEDNVLTSKKLITSKNIIR